MTNPGNNPRSTTGTISITDSEWRSTYRPLGDSTGDFSFYEIPESVRPGQVWTEVWRGSIRSVRSGALPLGGLPHGEEAISYYITECSVHPEVRIEVEPDPWTEADIAYVRAAHREWEQERGIGVSGRVAANDFDSWFYDNHRDRYELFDGRDAECLLTCHLPELDLWSLYIDYLGSEGQDGQPVQGIERGCGAEGLNFNEFNESRISKQEWMWRFLPRTHAVDECRFGLEWISDRPEQDAVLRAADPRCVWTEGVFGGRSVIHTGLLDLGLADWCFITEVPCPAGFNIQVVSDEEASGEDDGFYASSSIRGVRNHADDDDDRQGTARTATEVSVELRYTSGVSALLEPMGNSAGEVFLVSIADQARAFAVVIQRAEAMTLAPLHLLRIEHGGHRLALCANPTPSGVVRILCLTPDETDQLLSDLEPAGERAAMSRTDADGPEDDEDGCRSASNVKIVRSKHGVPRVQRKNLRIDLHRGDCLEVLRGLPDESVDVVITSPPYLSIVDYGGGTWEGGRKDCAHRLPRNDQGHFQTITGDTCPLCGAKRLTYALGMEPTLEAYLNNLCAIFDEVKRVLKDTGSLWVNIGDLYSPKASAYGIGGLGAGSLAMVPARFAIEMIDRHGWVLRNEVIWHKPSIRPMGFGNRLHVDFEPFFFFTKKATGYYFDQPEEPGATTDWRPGRTVWVEHLGPNPCGREGAFPLGVVERIILACCPPDGRGVAMDPFLGSGTTGIVAAHYGRDFIGIELDPAMFRATRDRFEDEGFGTTTHVQPVQKNLVMSRSSALLKEAPTLSSASKPAKTPAPAVAVPTVVSTAKAKAPAAGGHLFDPDGELGTFILTRMKGHRNYQVERGSDGCLAVVRTTDGVRLTLKQVREVRHGMLRRDRKREQQLSMVA